MTPSIRTTVIGSYPAPSWLRASRTPESLRDAMMVAANTQDRMGIDVVADGELHRLDPDHPETNGMVDWFVRQLEGVSREPTTEQLERWRQQRGLTWRASLPGVVVGPIRAGRLNLPAEYERFATLTKSPKKFTVTSPYMLAKTLADEHYGDLRALVLAIADVLQAQLADVPASMIQVDEANVTGSPGDGPLAAEGINRVLAGVKSSERAVHLCFGNYGGQTIQPGRWDQLVAFLNALDADCVLLELARRDETELAALRDVKPSIGIGAGVIDIKDLTVEPPETVARRLERTAAVLGGGERLTLAHPDCGFWMLPRSVADAKMAALVAGRDLFLSERGEL